MSGFQLTRENYYTREADRAFISCSQYQGFMECEARTIAALQGRYAPPENEAFLIGSYVHSWFEGESAHKEFCDQNFDSIFKTREDKKSGQTIVTGKYAVFANADRIIQTAKNDELIMSLVESPGENEQVFTGELFGSPWKVRVDKWIPSMRMIVDYKTCANITETKYNEKAGERQSFIEYYGYMMRAAVYSEIVKQSLHLDADPLFVIIALSKQDVPDKGAFLLNHRERWNLELETVRENMTRIAQVKAGYMNPTRCGDCDYCRGTKKLTRIQPYHALRPGFRPPREEEEHADGNMSPIVPQTA